MKNVALYLRVSTQDQTTELQRTELVQFAQARGWTILEVLSDQASGATDKREGLSRLLALCRSRKVDVVVCWKLDRLFRSLRHLVTTLNELNDLGVEFVSLKDQIDLTTPSGRLLTHLLAAFAEFEREIIRERVLAGLKAAKNKGKCLGRPRQSNPQLILALSKQGLSVTQIARQIGMSKATVSKILTKYEFHNSLNKSETIALGSGDESVE